MKRVLLGGLCLPLVVACVVENSNVPPPPPPPPPPTTATAAPTAAPTATPTATATATATSTATATATSSADAGPPADQDAGPADAGGGASAQYRACKMDNDCVAVPRAGCCNNGWKEAVASSQAQAYASSVQCQQRPICPHYMVLDSRVALCDNATHLCTMEKPEDVHCGGFIANSHKCPTGYTCPRSKIPDTGSICVKSP